MCDADVNCHSLDMPSRLKGIETRKEITTRRFGEVTFGYAFPFEGN